MIQDKTLTEDTYVVFDLETTGFYPNSGDSIIEIGAVKIKMELFMIDMMN